MPESRLWNIKNQLLFPAQHINVQISKTAKLPPDAFLLRKSRPLKSQRTWKLLISTQAHRCTISERIRVLRFRNPRNGIFRPFRFLYAQALEVFYIFISTEIISFPCWIVQNLCRKTSMNIVYSLWHVPCISFMEFFFSDRRNVCLGYEIFPLGREKVRFSWKSNDVTTGSVK